MKAWPRVHEVLEAVGLGLDLSRARRADVEQGLIRGAAVHVLVEADFYGYPADVAPEYAPYLDAWRKFRAESGYDPQVIEYEVRHRAWQYVGHPDSWGWLNGHRCIPDFKTGTTEGVAYQVAAYVLAHNDMHPTEPVTVGAVLELHDNGRYKFSEIDLPAATQVWLAALVVFRAQKGHT